MKTNINNQVVLHVNPQLIKRVSDPHDVRRWNYVGTIPALEALKLVRGTANPRESNINSKVSRAIRETIHEAPKEFHLRNRGLIISAVDANLDSEGKKLTLTGPSNQGNDTLWGVLDGGHTYDVLKDEADISATADGDGSLAGLKDTWVDIKIRVGLSTSEVMESAEANNTSAQLRPWTLANFRGEFLPLLSLVKQELPELALDIAFKENQLNEATGQPCEWDVLDVLQRMTLINVFRFPGDDPGKAPVEAYASKAKILDRFTESPEKYLGMEGFVGDAFRLPAIIEAKLSQNAKVHGNYAFLAKAKQGEIDKSLVGKHQLPRKYRISDAVLFPMAASLRPLIDVEDGRLRWINDPISFLDEHLGTLYHAFLGFYRENVEDKSQKASLSGMGKNAELWKLLHAKVLAILLKENRK